MNGYGNSSGAFMVELTPCGQKSCTDLAWLCRFGGKVETEKAFVSVDLGGTRMRLLAESAGHRRTRVVPTGRSFSGHDIELSLKQFLGELPMAPVCLGIAIPGLVDDRGQVVACDVLPRVEGIRKTSFEFAGCPVHLVNDVEAGLIEESFDLPPNVVSVLVMVGTGIGMAFKMNGKLCRGSNGWAGELGKIPISFKEGVRTLDDLASGASIVTRLGGEIGSINERIRAQDPDVMKCLKTAGWALGLGLASIINLLNPELLILGGGTLKFPGYYEAALESSAQHSMPQPWQACTIRRPREEELVVALGAIRFARNQDLINHP
jgi:predicted NBD/HSP70 family sugar kinase